jgi:outer membrane protein TolC
MIPCFSQEREMNELKLSLAKCIEMALENNLDIAAQRIDPEISQLDYEIAKAIFDPKFSASSSSSVSNNEPLSFLTTAKNERDFYDLSLSGMTVTGATYDFSINTSRNFVVARYPIDVNPFYITGFNVNFFQPLLRNFGKEITRYEILLSKNNYEISDTQFRQKVISIIEQVETAYWNLVGAIDQLKVQKESLKLAEDQLEQNKIMVKVGTKAPIDITEAEATVAERLVNVINAENTMKTAEDTLRKILNIYISPDSPLWHAVILPTDRPSFEKVSANLEETIETALRERPEIEETKLNMKNLDLAVRYQRNQQLPELGLQGSWGLSGSSALLTPGLDGLIGTLDDILIDEGKGGAFDDIWEGSFVNWSVGLDFSIPISNRALKRQYMIAKLEYEKANINLRSLQNTISIEVKETVRNIEMSLKRLDATRASRILSKERLNAIQKKFENGMATNFEVSEYQQALAAAESEEISALIEYNVALLSLEKVKGNLLQSRGIILEKTQPEI